MPDKTRPRPWFHLDVDFLHQDTIAELRDEFGPAGPLTILAIISEAKRSDLGGIKPPGEQGIVSVRAKALARLVGAPPSVVSAIVSHAVDLGLLECFVDGAPAAERWIVRSRKRALWEPKDATAAARARRRRSSLGTGE